MPNLAPCASLPRAPRQPASGRERARVVDTGPNTWLATARGCAGLRTGDRGNAVHAGNRREGRDLRRSRRTAERGQVLQKELERDRRDRGPLALWREALLFTAARVRSFSEGVQTAPWPICTGRCPPGSGGRTSLSLRGRVNRAKSVSETPKRRKSATSWSCWPLFQRRCSETLPSSPSPRRRTESPCRRSAAVPEIGVSSGLPSLAASIREPSAVTQASLVSRGAACLFPR